MNKVAYFLFDSDQIQDEKILVLKNQRTKIILDQIILHKKVMLSDLEKYLNLDHGNIQPHLKKLLEYNLISSIEENNDTYYIPIILETAEAITVKRDFDYLGGNIRFKVAIQNNTNMSINNIQVTLNPSEQFFWEDTIQRVSNLSPHNSVGVEFTLTPNTCGKTTIFGAVLYQDAFGNACTIVISPKEITIKCPLVVPQTITQFEIEERIKILKKSTGKIDCGGISEEKAFNIALNQIDSLDLFRVNVGLDDFESIYAGKVKITGQQIVVKLKIDLPFLIIDVWANDLQQTTGLLAYIRNLITISLEHPLKKIEKTGEIVRKISKIFSCGNDIKQCFDSCCNREKIKQISVFLTKIETDLDQFYPGFKFLDSINKWILKFNGMCEEEDHIDNEMTLELQYDLIDWLKQIQELVIYDIRVFQNSIENFEKYADDFKVEVENIEKNLKFIEKLYGLTILNYVIVIHKNNRISLYQEQLGSENLDTDIISSFITSIESFGSEMSKKNTSVMGLKYENYNIEIENGKYIQAILLLNGKINTYLTNALFNFVKEFENKFELELESFMGDISQFKSSKELLFRNFGLPG